MDSVKIVVVEEKMVVYRDVDGILIKHMTSAKKMISINSMI